MNQITLRIIAEMHRTNANAIDRHIKSIEIDVIGCSPMMISHLLVGLSSLVVEEQEAGHSESLADVLDNARVWIERFDRKCE